MRRQEAWASCLPGTGPAAASCSAGPTRDKRLELPGGSYRGEPPKGAEGPGPRKNEKQLNNLVKWDKRPFTEDIARAGCITQLALAWRQQALPQKQRVPKPTVVSPVVALPVDSAVVPEVAPKQRVPKPTVVSPVVALPVGSAVVPEVAPPVVSRL